MEKINEIQEKIDELKYSERLYLNDGNYSFGELYQTIRKQNNIIEKQKQLINRGIKLAKEKYETN